MFVSSGDAGLTVHHFMRCSGEQSALAVHSMFAEAWLGKV